jgi:NTP pyrophosphatase (non-canonical NTP hydrolase)
MNIEQYLIESERTERKFPDGLTVDKVTHTLALSFLKSIQIQGLALDQCKKVAVYGKPLNSCAQTIVDFMAKANDIRPDPNADDIELDQDRAETLHALLGLVTEMAEIIPPLLDYIFESKPVDVVNLAEEICDLSWYEAILLRKFGIDKSVALQKNIDKLKVRFPDKFSSENALNRDLEAEREALA